MYSTTLASNMKTYFMSPPMDRHSAGKVSVYPFEVGL